MKEIPRSSVDYQMKEKFKKLITKKKKRTFFILSLKQFGTNFSRQCLH